MGFSFRGLCKRIADACAPKPSSSSEQKTGKAEGTRQEPQPSAEKK